MKETKYVQLNHVTALLELIDKRNSYPDWMDGYEKYDKKINKTIVWLERNAKTLSQISKEEN